jgi:L,D-transpeptidase catalytic domain/Putative peptidoglycan binding domain
VHNRLFVSAAVAALASVTMLAGCGGHSSANNATNAPGASPSPSTSTTPIAPLKVLSVKPRKTVKPMGTITVAFTAPLTAQSPLPTLKPAVPGSWARAGSTAVFTPTQAYPPDSTVQVSVRKRLGAKSKVIATRATPYGSLLRVQQILAHLHYVPLSTSAATPTSVAAEAAAVYNPPHGAFSWRYSNTPTTLRHDWAPGEAGDVLRGAIIAFQHQAGLPVDGAIGQHTWHALVTADLADKVDPDKYSFVSANLHLPQTLSVWVDGQTVLSSPVNGGVSGAPTPLGTFPIYERLTTTTMSGTNPDGSHYSDPGVKWVNYFSGGSAVHGFPRASYGFPQSVGCLELPISTAEKVFGMVDYGTLVNVQGPFVPSSNDGKPTAPGGSTSPSPSTSPSASTTPKPTPTKTHKPH